MRSEEQTQSVVEFSGDLTIRAISGAYDTLVSAIKGNPSVVASVAEDAAVDLTFVQLFESARRATREAGGSLELTAPAGGQLLETLRRGGFLETAGAREFWLMQSGDL